MFGRKEAKTFIPPTKSSLRIAEIIKMTSHVSTSTHYRPYVFPGENVGYALVPRSYFEKYNLIVKNGQAKEEIPINIENLVETFKRTREIPTETEALLLHALISNAENGQEISRRKTTNIEHVIANAFLDGVQTVATGKHGATEVFLPYTEKFAGYNKAKMIRVITEEKEATPETIQSAYSLSRIPQVMDALHGITDHAVTLERIGDAVHITDARGQIKRVDLLTNQTKKTEKFDEEIAKAYAESRHGVDGQLLDPYLAKVLEKYAPGSVVADIGMGAGPVAINAIEAHATKVQGLDNSEDMLKQAGTAISNAETKGAITPGSIILTLGSAEDLPREQFPDNSFPLVLSVNVGCALTSNGIFGPHFSEMARIVTPDGKIFVTAPTNFGEVFTSGTKSKTEVLTRIAEKLLEVNNQTISADTSTQIQTLRSTFMQLGEINRATFARRNNKFVLVYNDSDAPEILKTNNLVISESELTVGEPIERKLAGSADTTGVVVPNYYHPQSEYLTAIEVAGLRIIREESRLNAFMTQTELDAYNTTLPPERQLGQEYLKHSPFDLYLLSPI